MGLMNFDKTIPYDRKTGVAGYFQLLLHNFFDLVLLNFLFVVCSLPIVTIGPAYTAFISVCNAYAEDKVVSPVREFFSEFKRRFLKSALYGLLVAAVLAVVAFGCYFYFIMAKQFLLFYVFALIAAVCLLLLIMMICWFFPMYAKTDFTLKELIVNSFVMSITNIKSSFAFLGVVFVCVALVAAFFPYSIPAVAILPFMLICLCSGCAAAEKINEAYLKADDTEVESEE